MSWLKRIEPVTLQQTSDLPYVILEDGVRLCFHNLFSEDVDHADHFIKFTSPKTKVERKSTNYWRLRKFPQIIPFEDILQLDHCIIEGKIIKHAQDASSDQKTISVTLPPFFARTDRGLEEFVEDVDENELNFLIVGENPIPEAHLLEDAAIIIRHSNWYKTAVYIADNVIAQSHRKYCWTRTAPELIINCRGFNSASQMEKFTRALEYIGITEYSCNWHD